MFDACKVDQPGIDRRVYLLAGSDPDSSCVKMQFTSLHLESEIIDISPLQSHLPVSRESQSYCDCSIEADTSFTFGLSDEFSRFRIQAVPNQT